MKFKHGPRSIAGICLAMFGITVASFSIFNWLNDDVGPTINSSAIHLVPVKSNSLLSERHRVEPTPATSAAEESSSRAEVSTELMDQSDDSQHVVMNVTKMRRDISASQQDTSDFYPWINPVHGVNDVLAQTVTADRNWTLAWLELQVLELAESTVAELKNVGVEVLGTSENLLRARVPRDRAILESVVAMHNIDGIGAFPFDRKVSTEWLNNLATTPASEKIRAFVTLMGNDRNLWEAALQDLDAVVTDFHPVIRVFEITVPAANVAEIAMQDFVLKIEPIGEMTAAHNTSVPAMGADALRTFLGDGQWGGQAGSSIPIGGADTGLNLSHPDISSNRKSICGANFSTGSFAGGLREGNLDLWEDQGFHGTHTVGTMIGNGSSRPIFSGIAPGVQHIRFAKVLKPGGSGSLTGIVDGLEYLAQTTACPEAGWTDDAVKALVVNVSLGDSSPVYEGRTAVTRKLDTIIWGSRQLYVVSQANSGQSAFSNFASAKNALAVGAVLDAGEIADFSSWGPTFDNRLAPNVVATGVDVISTLGLGATSGYISSSGTSMSSPITAGVAALVLESLPLAREFPALARARLMATAIRPNGWLNDPDRFPSTNSNGPGELQAQYGLGRVSAQTATMSKFGSRAWLNYYATLELDHGEEAYVDVFVPEGTARLDLVMTWDEPATETIASTVLNNFDLWLDYRADCQHESACGEYSSTSKIDNVEWVFVKNPEPGTYRIKVLAERVYTEAPRVALAWTVIRGNDTPTLQVTSSIDELELNASAETSFELEVSTESYIATGTRLHVECRTEDGANECENVALSSTRLDDVQQDVELPMGQPLSFGELAVAEPRSFKVSYPPSSESVRLYFTFSAWNGHSKTKSVSLRAPESTSSITREDQPMHDQFALASELQGSSGSVNANPLGSGLESNEPDSFYYVFDPDFQANIQHIFNGSIWYRWTAPTSGPYRFGMTPSNPAIELPSEEAPQIDIYSGEDIDTLTRHGSKFWNIAFFADAGTTYYVRLSYRNRAAPMLLAWTEGLRPLNDDFAAAVTLTGEVGEIEDNNQGGTIERGEFGSTLTATVWYEWTAPTDGFWDFQLSTSRLVLSVYAGEDISSLRLLSGYLQNSATIKVKEGAKYRIVVAATNAYASGSTYKLEWNPHDPLEPTTDANDYFESPEVLPPLQAFETRIALPGNNTVEPDEPIATGVHTTWFSWSPGTTGTYTFDVFREALFGAAAITPVMTVWQGGSLQDLTLLATNTHNGSVTGETVSFAANASEAYSIAIGYSPLAVLSFTSPAQSLSFFFGNTNATLGWGPTPENDNLASAIALDEVAGSLSGSNRYATAQIGERTDGVGDASVWYTFDGAEDGFHEFAVNANLLLEITVYEVIEGDGFSSLRLVRRGTRDSMFFFTNRSKATVATKANVKYVIRIGASIFATGTQFTFQWQPTAVPAGLALVEHVVDGGQDAVGNVVNWGLNDRDIDYVSKFDQPGLALAINQQGSMLFVGSRHGLHVFERDADTGLLTQIQHMVDFSDIDPGTANFADGVLHWDAHRNRLYAVECSNARFHTVGAASEHPGQFAEDRMPYGAESSQGFVEALCQPDTTSPPGEIIADPYGSYLYAWNPEPTWKRQLRVLGFDRYGNIQQVASELEADHVDLTRDGSLAFLTRDSVLDVYSRNSVDGRLSVAASAFAPPASDIALGVHDNYMLHMDSSGRSFAVFDVSSGQPFLLRSEEFQQSFVPGIARLAAPCNAFARNGDDVAFDILCRHSTYTLQWSPFTGEFAVDEVLTRGDVDIRSNTIPDFKLRHAIASPDGKHLYLASLNGLHIYERMGNQPTLPTDEVFGGYARLDMLEVGVGSVSIDSATSNDCIALNQTELANGVYTAMSSAWQVQDAFSGEWGMVADTQKTNEICAFSPPDEQLYRLTVELTVNEATGKYASNIIGLGQMQASNSQL